MLCNPLNFEATSLALRILLTPGEKFYLTYQTNARRNTKEKAGIRMTTRPVCLLISARYSSDRAQLQPFQ